MSPLALSLSESDSGTLWVFDYASDAAYALRTLWEEIAVPPSSKSTDSSVSHVAEESRVSYSLAEPETTGWSVAFTPTFKKAIATADRKLQGRILGAVSDLSSEPLTSHGDTVKPLSGELKGLWRYRIGDFRLIYKPTLDLKTVVLLEFAPRGGAYE